MTMPTIEERLASFANAYWLVGYNVAEFETGLAKMKRLSGLSDEECSRARIVFLANELDMRRISQNVVEQGARWDVRR